MTMIRMSVKEQNTKQVIPTLGAAHNPPHKQAILEIHNRIKNDKRKFTTRNKKK